MRDRPQQRKVSEPALSPLRPRRDSATHSAVRWQPAPPKAHESARWENVDGRWVAIALGEGDELGRAVVLASGDRRAVVDSYEQALAVAETWRS